MGVSFSLLPCAQGPAPGRVHPDGGPSRPERAGQGGHGDHHLLERAPSTHQPQGAFVQLSDTMCSFVGAGAGLGWVSPFIFLARYVVLLVWVEL